MDSIVFCLECFEHIAETPLSEAHAPFPTEMVVVVGCQGGTTEKA